MAKTDQRQIGFNFIRTCGCMCVCPYHVTKAHAKKVHRKRFETAHPACAFDARSNVQELSAKKAMPGSQAITAAKLRLRQA